jgi:hypothetical protein
MMAQEKECAMRLPLLAFLCAGTVAFCQCPGQRKIDPDKLFQMPDKFTHPAPDVNGLKSFPPMEHNFILNQPLMILPRMKPDAPQIDPKIKTRPLRRRESGRQDVARQV